MTDLCHTKQTNEVGVTHGGYGTDLFIEHPHKAGRGVLSSHDFDSYLVFLPQSPPHAAVDTIIQGIAKLDT